MVNANLNTYSRPGIRPYGNLWESGTLTTNDFWSVSSSGTDVSVGNGRIRSDISKSGSGGYADTITTKLDLKTIHKFQMAFSFASYFNDGASSFSITLTDGGANSATIVSYSESSDWNPNTNSNETTISGGGSIFLTFDGTNINIKRNVDCYFVGYPQPGPQETISIAANNANVNVSSWSNVYLRMYTYQAGSYYGAGGDGSGRTTASYYNFLVTDYFTNSNNTE